VKTVDSLRERFADDEDAAIKPEILIEAYQELADICQEVGETEEADKYAKRIELLKQRLKR